MLILNKFIQISLALQTLAGLVSAEYWRFSVQSFTSIETREWEVDHIRSVINLVAGGRNNTVRYKIGDIPQGYTVTQNDTYQIWKDITMTGSEPNLTVAWVLYNIGDDDPQEEALKILSLAFNIVRRIPVIGNVLEVIGEFVNLFDDAYECNGPVAVRAPIYSQAQLQSMQRGVPDCVTEGYSYKTQPGCDSVIPTSKNTNYEATTCLTRFEGESNVAFGSAISEDEFNGAMGKAGAWRWVLYGVPAVVVWITIYTF